jgi:RNA polymerase sigma-70 factor (ECF subfamily)
MVATETNSTECGEVNVSEQMTEREAIRRAQNGDSAGLGRLYELHRFRIYSWCLHHTSDTFDAEDLTQDVFIRVFSKIGTFRGDAKFTSWLYKVALNFVRLRARERRRDDRFVVRHVSDEALHSVRARNSDPMQSAALKQALSNLTSLRRNTVLLHDVEGFTHNEIAWRTRATVVASKSRLHRAHVALRDILSRNGHELHSKEGNRLVANQEAA